MSEKNLYHFVLIIENLVRSSARLLVYFYQRILSPLKPPTCRFHPTCSHYARTVLEEQPLGRAIKLIFRRLISCHPWGGYGYDPPPNDPQNLKKPSSP